MSPKSLSEERRAREGKGGIGRRQNELSLTGRPPGGRSEGPVGRCFLFPYLSMPPSLPFCRFPYTRRPRTDVRIAFHRALKREENQHRVNLLPFLYAERDRDAYRRQAAALAREAEIMKNVPGWEVRFWPSCSHPALWWSLEEGKKEEETGALASRTGRGGCLDRRDSTRPASRGAASSLLPLGNGLIVCPARQAARLPSRVVRQSSTSRMEEGGRFQTGLWRQRPTCMRAPRPFPSRPCHARRLSSFFSLSPSASSRPFELTCCFPRPSGGQAPVPHQALRRANGHRLDSGRARTETGRQEMRVVILLGSRLAVFVCHSKRRNGTGGNTREGRRGSP